MITVQQITDYLSENISDPVPKFVFIKEILKKDPASNDYLSAYEQLVQSKPYRKLASEQWEDGSWGQFHGVDSKAPKKQKYGCTEAALRQALEFSLPKDDPMIAKCIKIMERYVRGDETYPDRVEKHKDNGKGHMYCRPFMAAANISMFEPENPVISPLREVAAQTTKTAFAGGSFDDDYWAQRVNDYQIPSILHPWVAYSAMLLRNTNCMDDTLQRQYMDFIWNGKNGIYYVSKIPPADNQFLEDRLFDQWLRTLELLSGFSLFPEFMNSSVTPHLLSETDRLITDADKNKHTTDLVLRIARILVKC